MRTVTLKSAVRVFGRVNPGGVRLARTGQAIPPGTVIEVGEDHEAEELDYDHRPQYALPVKWDGIETGRSDYGEYFVLESELKIT